MPFGLHPMPMHQPMMYYPYQYMAPSPMKMADSSCIPGHLPMVQGQFMAGCNPGKLVPEFPGFGPYQVPDMSQCNGFAYTSNISPLNTKRQE